MSETGVPKPSDNRGLSLTTKSNAGDNALVTAWADPTTHRLLVNNTYGALGQATMANSMPVVIASDQSAVASNITQVAGVSTTNTFDVNGGWNVRPAADTGTLGDARTNAPSNLQSNSGNSMSLVSYPYVFNGTTWDRLRGDATNGAFVNVKASTTLQTVSGSNATSTLTNVAGSASSVTLLASNANRRGATIVNDSTAILYVKFGTTASSTSYTVLMNPNDYYEVPFAYSGIISGIWASATGNARVTEITA